MKITEKRFLLIIIFMMALVSSAIINAETSKEVDQHLQTSVLRGMNFQNESQSKAYLSIYQAYQVALNNLIREKSVSASTNQSLEQIIAKSLEAQISVSELKSSTAKKIAKEISPLIAATFIQREPLSQQAIQTISGATAISLRDQLGTIKSQNLKNTVGTTDSQNERRPRIGLVLGGGGARGAAHVGALKVLEEAQIPIDYIAGTSMGAIVGAAYASGMSPDEIESTLLDINWRDLFTDTAPRKDLSFRDKMDQRRFLGFEVGIKDGALVVPQGAFAGRKLQFLLKSVYLRTAKIATFDELAIPFRAVATNIETGDPVILSDGDLATAVRASMSIPGAFPPVDLNGPLVDGYVSMNLPIEVIKQMGAEIIIAIDVGTPLSEKEALNSLLSIVNQVGGIATIKNVKEQEELLSNNDILLRPNLGDTSTIAFENIAKIIPLGEESARSELNSLKRFSVDPAAYQVFLEKQRSKPASDILIEFIDIEATKHVTKERIAARLGLLPGSPLNLNELSEALDRVQSIKELEQVGFDLVQRGSKTGLLIKPVEKSWAPNIVRAGLQVESDFDTDNYYNVLIDYTRVGINDLGAQWQNEFQFGKTIKAASEFYQPLDDSEAFFVVPRAEYTQDLTDIYEGHDRIAEYRTRRYGISPDLGFHLGTAAEMRGGLFFGKSEAERSTGSTDLPEISVDRGAAHGRFTYDQVDNPNFPRHGIYARTSGWLEREGLSAEESYEKYTLDAIAPITFGRHTFLPRISVGFDPEDRIPYYSQFVLGGANSLSGYNTDELRGGQMLLGKLRYYYQLSNQYFSFARSSYVGFTLDQGNVWNRHSDIALDDLVFGGSVFYAIETIMGPVYVTYGINEDVHDGVFSFSLGQRL